MITQPFHVRTKTLIAKIQLYNNSYYCFKNDAQYILPKGWSGEEKGGKSSPKLRNKTKCKYIPEIFERHRCQRHFLYTIRQYLLAETLVLILNASQGNLSDIIHLTKLSWHQKTFRTPKRHCIIWQEYSQFIQQWNKSVLHSVSILYNLLFKSPFQNQSLYNFQLFRFALKKKET